jgi:PKD domain
VRIKFALRGALVVVGVAASGLVAAPSALAIQTIVVNTNRDGAVPGKTTLRQAIDRANLAAGEVDIVLAARGTYALSQCGPGTDETNRQGPLTYYGGVTLTISGNGNTLRQTCSSDRVLNLLSSNLVNINDLTVAGGDAAGQPGGGIWSQAGGELDLKNDVFTGNHSDAAGGGVAAAGKVVATGTTFTLNSGTELAGAIASTGPIELVKSTVTGNNGGTAPTSPANVGGIAASDGLTMIYSTVQDNTAQNINVQSGGLTSYGSVVGLARTGRTYPSCQIGGGTTSLGYNFSNDASCGFGHGAGDRSNGGDPKLRPQNSPSGALEIVPAPHSRLIDAISRSRCAPRNIVSLAPVWAGLTTDQFGTPRPQGRGCDIGAVEVPVPVARIHVLTRHPREGSAVRFSGAGSRVFGGRIVRYIWSFGDRSRRASGASVKHSYRRAGRYTIALTVVDRAGSKAAATARIRIAR